MTKCSCGSKVVHHVACRNAALVYPFRCHCQWDSSGPDLWGCVVAQSSAPYALDGPLPTNGLPAFRISCHTRRACYDSQITRRLHYSAIQRNIMDIRWWPWWLVHLSSYDIWKKACSNFSCGWSRWYLSNCPKTSAFEIVKKRKECRRKHTRWWSAICLDNSISILFAAWGVMVVALWLIVSFPPDFLSITLPLARKCLWESPSLR